MKISSQNIMLGCTILLFCSGVAYADTGSMTFKLYLGGSCTAQISMYDAKGNYLQGSAISATWNENGKTFYTYQPQNYGYTPGNVKVEVQYPITDDPYCPGVGQQNNSFWAYWKENTAQCINVDYTGLSSC